jgi:hypothetical protein
MELFDPTAYYRPISEVPPGFSGIAHFNEAFSRDPDAILDIVREQQYAVRLRCETLLSPLKWSSSTRVAPTGGLYGKEPLVRSPLMDLEPLPLDVVLPINMDCEDRMYTSSLALTMSVGLEILRTLGQQSESETLRMLTIARARSLYWSFSILQEMEARQERK